MKAFTIPELMVVMLLSGIVISVVYLMLQYSFSGYLRYYKASNQLNSLLKLEYLLTMDTNRAAVLQKTEKGFLFADEAEKIEYVVSDSMLVRVGKGSDTIRAEYIQCRLYLDSALVVLPGGTARTVDLQIQSGGETLVMQYQQAEDAGNFLFKQ